MGGNGLTEATGMSFHSFFLFNLLYYSYKMRLQSFEGLGAVVAELHGLIWPILTVFNGILPDCLTFL
jgi:hypothetical protein